MSALQRIFRKYIGNDISPEEKKLVEGWYDAYEAADLPELTRAEQESVRTQLWSRLVTQLQLQPSLPAGTIAGNFRRRRLMRYGMAAAVIGITLSAAGLIAYYTWNKPVKREFSDIRTLAGQWKKILLPDNSVIKLSPNSRVRFNKAFDGPLREILVSEGEAWYDVAHDSLRPFIIHTGQLTVRVLGTSFNVSAIQGTKEQSILVRRGRVQVQEQQKLLGILTAGRQLVFDSANGRFHINDHKDLAAEQMEQGWLVLDNVSWPVLQAMLGGRYNVGFADRRHKMEQAFFTASFKPNTPLPEIMQVLCGIHNLKFEIKDHLVIVE